MVINLAIQIFCFDFDVWISVFVNSYVAVVADYRSVEKFTVDTLAWRTGDGLQLK